MIRVRPFVAEDRAFILSLVPRLLIGMPPWRDPQKWIAAFESWVAESMDQHGQQAMVFVAQDEQAHRLGFATLTRTTHFTGEPQAYVNELATSEAAEGRGAGKALLEACEQWARDQGYRMITLSTGASNAHALGFYHHLGYRDEDIKLVKLLDGDTNQLT